MPACVCAINTWTLHTCDIPGSAGRTHWMPHAGLCLCYQHLNTSHLWRTWFSRENPLWRHMLACVCAINSITPEHFTPVTYLVQQGEPIVTPHAGLCLCYQHLNTSHLWHTWFSRENPLDATCRPVSVLSTPEHFTPVTYLVQQGEPIATPHASLCLCYQHLNTSHLWRTWFSRENPLRRHMPACVCAINTWTLRAGSISSTTSSRFCTATINSDTVGQSPVTRWDNHQWQSGTITSGMEGQSTVSQWVHHQWQGGTITSNKVRQSPVNW